MIQDKSTFRAFRVEEENGNYTTSIKEMEFGTLDNVVEYLCEVAHAQARYLGLLEINEKAWEITDWKERIKKFSDALKEK